MMSAPYASRFAWNEPCGWLNRRVMCASSLTSACRWPGCCGPAVTRRRAPAAGWQQGEGRRGIQPSAYPVLPLGAALPVEDFENSNWHMFQVVLPEERLMIKRAEVMAQMP
mgnify:CR=1 FL=1